MMSASARASERAPATRHGMSTSLSEHALSIVVDNSNNHAIAERDALLARIAALEEECQRLRGDFGPEDGRFAIATYQLEQRFHIPADATSWEVKWGMLRYWTADGETHEAPPFAGETFEDWDAEYMKRPTTVRCMDEDESGLWEDTDPSSDGDA